MNYSHIFSTSLRLNLNKDEDFKAYKHLMSFDRQKYKSYSQMIVTALNEYFDRHNHLKEDPYLETRQKEDEFLKKVIRTIETGLQTTAQANAANSLFQLLQGVQAVTAKPEEHNTAEQEEVSDAALDFADSF